MYNWSTDTKRLKKNSTKYTVWKLEQQLNFGLDGKKISSDLLKKHWNDIKIDPKKKSFLKKIVWPQS